MNLLLIILPGALLTFNPEFGLGADYSSQRYRAISGFDTLNYEWTEDDTTDIETEGRGFVDLDLGCEAGRLRLDINNTTSLSTLSARDLLGLRAEFGLLPGLRIDFTDDAEARWYHGWFPAVLDSSWSGEDYFNNRAGLEVEYEPIDRLELTAGDRLELMRYASPDSYSYDFLLNRLELGARVGLGDFSSFDVEYGWAQRDAEVLVERDYVEHAIDVGLDLYPGSGFSFGLGNELARRTYGTAAGSGTEERACVRAGWDFGTLALEVADDASWTWYDSVTAVYANVLENSLRPSFEVRPGDELALRFGPRWDFGRGLAGPGENDYVELSVVGGLDFFRLGRFWTTVEDRVGWRRYPNADTTWQSNYAFNEFSLFLSWTVLPVAARGLMLEGMASVTPEWHADRSDDLSIALFSLELKYGF
jgi:hypothetical protein